MRFRPGDFRLLVGTHTHGQITPAFCQSLAILTGQLAAWGVAHGVSIVRDCFVTSGRDRLAALCLEGEFTHLLMLDADVEFEPRAVARLLAADRDLVAGAYRKKEETGQFAISFLGGSEEGAPWDEEAQALEVDGVGAGFMLVRRGVFERMARELPQIAYVEQRDDGTPRPRHAFFEQVIGPDGHRVSEDILFCRRWRSLGGRVWVVPDLALRHWGSHAWEGRLADVIRLTDAAAE
jgi:hypothetical protein